MNEQGTEIVELEQTSSGEAIKALLHAEKIRKARETEFEPDDPNQVGLISEEWHARAFVTKGQLLEKGRLLTDANRILDPEEFKEFYEQDLGIKKATAYNMINVYKHCGNRPWLAASIKHSILLDICRKNFPSDLREHLFEQPGYQLKEMPVEEFQDTWKRVKNKELALDSPEIQALTEREKEMDERTFYDAQLGIYFQSLERFKNRVVGLREKVVTKVPTFHGKTILTKQEAEELETLFGDIVGAIEGLKPEYEIEDAEEG